MTPYGTAAPAPSAEGTRPFAAALALAHSAGRALVLDGASGTEFERMGADVSGDLWAAALLDTDPARVTAMHRAYLEAGAEVLESISYQATVPGLVAAGHSAARARELLVRSWHLVAAVVDGRAGPHGAPVLAASSIGPYGAYLADGSEYTGAYPPGIDGEDLAEFHAERIDLLAAAGCRLFACETIPHAAEVTALVAVMAAHPDAEWWLSLSIRRDGAGRIVLADGTPVPEVLAGLPAPGAAGAPAAVGINCCPAALVAPALAEIAAGGYAALAYPNSGEIYDAATGTWSPPADGPEDSGGPESAVGPEGSGGPVGAEASAPTPRGDLATAAALWVEAGAVMVGGCCRTAPEDIGALAAVL